MSTEKLKYHCIVHEDRPQFVRLGETVGLCRDCFLDLDKVGRDKFQTKYGVSLEEPQEREKLVYSIGYQGKKLDAFLTQLETRFVDVVVDVRSKPYSRYAKEFNKKNLQDALNNRGIKYVWRGRELGGLEGNTFERWRENLEGIAKGCKTLRPVIMCMEKNYTSCHRQHLAKILIDNYGCVVEHL